MSFFLILIFWRTNPLPFFFSEECRLPPPSSSSRVRTPSTLSELMGGSDFYTMLGRCFLPQRQHIHTTLVPWGCQSFAGAELQQKAVCSQHSSPRCLNLHAHLGRLPAWTHWHCCLCQKWGEESTAYLHQMVSVAMPADSRCDKKFETVFEIAGARLWKTAGETFLGGWAGLKIFRERFGAFFELLASLLVFGIQNYSGQFRSAEVPMLHQTVKKGAITQRTQTKTNNPQQKASCASCLTEAVCPLLCQ